MSEFASALGLHADRRRTFPVRAGRAAAHGAARHSKHPLDLAATAQLVSDQGIALDGVVSSHESNISNQQNDDTRKISAFAALLSVPTVLAGLFGMNFKNLPGVSWTYGWEALIAVVVILDVLMFINFKRRHWL